MRIVPRNKSPQIAFFRSHLPTWAAHAEQLGIAPELIAELQASMDEAAELLTAQGAAEAAASSATAASYRANQRMATLGANVISQIRATARVSGNQIYILGSLPLPDKASPIAPPGRPTSLKVELLSLGWLKLKWQCKHPRGSQGTLYRVSRCLDSMTGPFEFLGVAGEKEFVDDSIPHGTVSVTYEIQAVRTTGVGKVGQFPVALNSIARNLGNGRLGSIRPRKAA